MKNYLGIVAFSLLSTMLWAQSNVEKESLKFNINNEGTHYFQATFLNQTWIRYNQSNPGTLVEGLPQKETFDIGLRRTRMQLFGQITDKAFIYFQFGQNNFNPQFNIGSNRKLAAFFHDALCEFKVSKGNQLKLGGGLTIANGLSRFSQPSIGTILTLDVPVGLQTTVDQTDEFSRKLSLYARGQVGKLDYRLVLSDPFPIASNGQALPTLSTNANFAQLGHHKQVQGYFIWQFLEQEGHNTPYMTGTYLGKKKVFNIAMGGIFQKNAMWRRTSANDTAYQNMTHFAIESFLDMPLNKEKGTAISVYAGYINTNFGTKYLRYNGIMNPANGTSLSAQNSIAGQGPTFGNAVPMFGTGTTVYTQLGYLLPSKLLSGHGQLMPYVTATIAKYDRLNGLSTNTFDAGINWFLSGHKSKITLDLQNRPTYEIRNSRLLAGDRKNSLTLQYQIFI